MKYILAAITLFLSLTSYSGELDTVFSEGVFGTKWGQTYDEVFKVFPDGEKETSYGSTRITVEDGREVLGIKRDSDSEIVFAFDADGRLYHVGVTFRGSDDFSKLMRKLDTLFGERAKDEAVNAPLMIKWEDEKTTISIIYVSGLFSSEAILGIQHLGLQKNTKSKEELGF